MGFSGDQEKMREAMESIAKVNNELIQVARETIVDVEEPQAKKIEQVIEELQSVLPDQIVLAKELFK